MTQWLQTCPTCGGHLLESYGCDTCARSKPVQTAREFAHKAYPSCWYVDSGGKHIDLCDRLTAAIEARDAEFDRAFKVQAAELDSTQERAQLAAALQALQAIAEYETDWAKGVAENVNALQAIAELVLTEARPTPTATLETTPAEAWEEHAKHCKNLHHNAACILRK